MTPREQASLVKSYCRYIESHFKKNAHKIPEDWDGHQLRQYVAYIAKSEIAYMSMSRVEKKSFMNTIIVENL